MSVNIVKVAVNKRVYTWQRFSMVHTILEVYSEE